MEGDKGCPTNRLNPSPCVDPTHHLPINPAPNADGTYEDMIAGLPFINNTFVRANRCIRVAFYVSVSAMYWAKNCCVYAGYNTSLVVIRSNESLSCGLKDMSFQVRSFHHDPLVLVCPCSQSRSMRPRTILTNKLRNAEPAQMCDNVVGMVTGATISSNHHSLDDAGGVTESTITDTA